MPDNTAQTDQSRCPPKKEYNGYILLGIALVGLAVLGIAALLCFKVAGGTLEYGTLAILILVGVAAFLLLMNLLSFSAGQLGILTHGQAFGLPDGSVRAILTMAFIVLIGVIGSYLVTKPASTPYAKDSVATLATCVSSAQANEVKRQVTGSDVLVVLTPCERAGGGAPQSGAAATTGSGAGAPQSSGTTGGVAGQGAGGGGAPSPGAGGSTGDTYNVLLYPRLDTRLSDDIAKQILTMLTTIVTAMIGFYFGSKQGSDETDRVSGKPNAPAPPDRDAAAKTIDEQLTNAPNVEQLQSRAQKLNDSSNLETADRDEVKQLRGELADLQKTLGETRATRAANTTTPAQMQTAAAHISKAVSRLQFIQRHFTDLERKYGLGGSV